MSYVNVVPIDGEQMLRDMKHNMEEMLGKKMEAVGVSELSFDLHPPFFTLILTIKINVKVRRN